MSEPAIQSDVAVLDSDDVAAENRTEAGPRLAVRSFGLTDKGQVRPKNEDQFLIATLLKSLRAEQTSLRVPPLLHSGDQCHLFIVADGMGGHAGGEEASALAIDSVESFVLDTFRWFAQFKGKEEDRVLKDFQTALGLANARLLAEGAERPELQGMATTLTLAYSQNDRLFVAHAGDTRCYLFRDRRLHRLTSDHTLVEEMVRYGALQAEQVPAHQWRHVVTNAVGGHHSEIKVEVHKLQLAPEDEILLCSDGLTNMVSDEEIARILAAEPEPKNACRQLVGHANDAGGKDNITVVIACYDSVS
jgi:protein phosphatase